MTKTQHFQIIDIVRGAAIVLMFIYHFCFDLSFFAYVSFQFNSDPFWLNFRLVIVTSFLLIVGISLAIASNKKLNRKNFIRRLSLLLLYALFVSLSSYVMYPDSMIFFGILHFIALASILGLIFRKTYWLNLIIGISIIFASNVFSSAIFDHSYLQWIGLMTHRPITEDYVPLFPWFGVVLIGMFVGKWLFIENPPQFIIEWRNWSTNTLITRILTFLGQHSLHVYILHQPIFIGLLYCYAYFFA